MAKDEVLDTNILMGGQAGTTTILNAIEYPKALEGANRFLLPTRKDYLLSIEIASNLLRQGKPLPAIDLVVAAMCLNRRMALRTRDAHFKLIQELYPGFDLRLATK